MADLNNTVYFTALKNEKMNVNDVIKSVYKSLVEQGYNPISQLVGYIMSGDPTYITSHGNARSLVMKVERDEIVEELIKSFIEQNNKTE